MIITSKLSVTEIEYDRKHPKETKNTEQVSNSVHYGNVWLKAKWSYPTCSWCKRRQVRVANSANLRCRSGTIRRKFPGLCWIWRCREVGMILRSAAHEDFHQANVFLFSVLSLSFSVPGSNLLHQESWVSSNILKSNWRTKFNLDLPEGGKEEDQACTRAIPPYTWSWCVGNITFTQPPCQAKGRVTIL